MAGIKTTPADKWFSLCVRKRAGWNCERCGKGYGGPSQALHSAHFHGRGKHATRHDPRNAASLCMGCHLYLTAHPSEHCGFFLTRLGQYQFDALQERVNDQATARECKRSLKQIASHYKAEFERMAEGEGFDAWV